VTTSLAGVHGVRTIDEVDGPWITNVLRRSGAIADGASVTIVSRKAVGTGQMAATYRLVLAGDGSYGGPESVIVKCASSDEQSRSTGLLTRAYEIEVSFYAEVAGLVRTRMPACHLGWCDAEAGWFVLVLEDVTDGSQGEQLAGCTVDAAAAALEELAALHGPVWGSESVAQRAWLNRASAESHAFTTSLVTPLLPGFLDRYGDRLAPEHVAVCEQFIGVLGPWLTRPTGPPTATHGDFRLDNLLFVPGDPRPWVVDWQTAAWGPPAGDVAYFLGGSLTVADRRTHERDLLASYHQRLVAQGVEGYPSATFEHDYRLAAYGGLLMTIGASMLVQRTERGDELFATSAQRYAQQILDNGAEALLSGLP